MVDEENKKEKGHHKKNMGPHGLGDPDDKFLRKVEKNVLIEKMMRDIARTDKCKAETDALEKCGREQSWKAVMLCREENNKMKDCMGYWYFNNEFREEVTQMYLKQRAEYRRTGLNEKTKKELKEKGYVIKSETEHKM